MLKRKWIIVMLVLCLLAGCSGTGGQSQAEEDDTVFSEMEGQMDLEPTEELPEIPPISMPQTPEDYQEYYIESLLKCEALRSSWEVGTSLESYYMAAYAYVQLKEQIDLSPYVTDSGAHEIPGALLEEQVGRYFDVPEETIRTGFNWYNSQTHTYNCWDPWGDDREVANLIVEEEDAQVLLDFDLVQDEETLANIKLALARGEEGLRFLSCEYTDMDYVGLSVAMDVALVRNELVFDSSEDISSPALMDYAMFLIDRENYRRGEWANWGYGTEIPLDVILEVLELHLEEVDFRPQEIEEYNAGTQTFSAEIGGYGGGRFPVVQERTQEEDILSLTLDYGSEDGTQLYYSKTYRYRLLEDGGYKLLSISRTELS